MFGKAAAAFDRNAELNAPEACAPFPMILEMRTYKIRPGNRTEFLEVLQSKAIPEHHKIGMKILGPFLSIEDEHTFFWMRAFPDLKSRNSMKENFGRRNSNTS
jgi:hypothetical protein